MEIDISIQQLADIIISLDGWAENDAGRHEAAHALRRAFFAYRERTRSGILGGTQAASPTPQAPRSGGRPLSGASDPRDLGSGTTPAQSPDAPPEPTPIWPPSTGVEAGIARAHDPYTSIFTIQQVDIPDGTAFMTSYDPETRTLRVTASRPAPTRQRRINTTNPVTPRTVQHWAGDQQLYNTAAEQLAEPSPVEDLSDFS